MALYITLLLLSLITPLVSSLSTFSIYETSNQTIICALTTNSTNRRAYSLNCTSTDFTVNPSASFSGIVSGDGFLCSLRTLSSSSSSIMHCWRLSATGMIYKRIYQGPALHQLEAGNSHICGLVNGTNRLQCWQWPEFNSNSTQNFTSIAVGEDFLCGLSQTGNITCLSTGSTSVTGPDRVFGGSFGSFSVISAGFRNFCAIKESDRGLVCWEKIVGGDWEEIVGGAGEEVPQGKFTGVALGYNRTCALRDNGTVVCWGQNNFTLPTALQETSFLSIEAKTSVFCGVSTNNFSLYCWGSEDFKGSNFKVFDQILPAPCTTRTCPCNELPGSGLFCSQGESVCLPCDRKTPPSVIPPTPSPQQKPPPQGKSSSGGWNGKMVALLVVGCVGSLSWVLVSAYFLYRFCRGRGCRVHDSGRLDKSGGSQSEHDSENPQPQPPTPVLEKRLSQLASMGNVGHLEVFALQELLEITNNFSENHKIGTGSFGSVYQATLEDGRQVAIKRAEISNISPTAIVTKRQEDKDNAFLNELESLSRLHHRNLVRLLGFCEDNNELVLVYEFMSNGSLHDHLHSLESSPLMSWPKRIKVALDAARGIEYLHEYAVPTIIHRDIKSSNILLDATWTAKVSDFGLSLMGPSDDESHLSLRAAGTFGYMDPEYYRLQKLTTKSDVYSFGVVLLEMLSGYRAIHKNENGVPRNVVDFVVPYIIQDEIHRVLDPRVPPPTPYEIEAVTYVGYLAADCVHLEGRDRPSMTDTVNSLERALNACSVLPPSLSRSTTHSSI
ncbi:hypothetical protein LWI28_017543 [Acer negundo]|uniref:non-specific serine/threonine protein kinase n=1 Tax=Acer negundo TaxID=4023 RepID=A0AAD5JU50_ACENE|nr:hypothetical protein LWI28_017543 [Acer negundo]KAK4859962.1 hypothetical protein QYF36_014984 [Acer negundo]